MTFKHLNNTYHNGFTLIEVMIALAVVSIGLLATLNAANQEIKGAVITQDKMTAYWLMQNKITELRLNKNWPAIRNNKGTDKVFGQLWRWQTNTKKTKNINIRSTTIRISPNSQPISDDPVLENTIYIGKKS